MERKYLKSIKDQHADDTDNHRICLSPSYQVESRMVFNVKISIIIL